MALLLQLQGALLLVVRYFADMLHLTQLYELAFGAFMRYFVERDLVPDFLLRRGIRLLLRKRLAEVCRASRPQQSTCPNSGRRVPALHRSTRHGAPFEP
jgi:hypothetical protein